MLDQGCWAHRARAGMWSYLHPQLLLHVMGSDWAPWLQEEGLGGCEGQPCQLGTGHRHLCLAGLCCPSMCASTARIYQAAIAMVTLKMVLFQAG